MASLCDVEEGFLKELAETALPQMGSVDPNVLQRIQQQPWYQEDEQVRQLLANVNLEFVVDGPEALARLAQRYCDGGGPHPLSGPAFGWLRRACRPIRSPVPG